MKENVTLPIVLIIEPTRLYQELLCGELADANVEIEMVKTGEEAIEMVSQRAVSLVFVANELKDMNGVELTPRLREYLGDKIPVLLFSSSDDEKLVSLALNNNVTEVISRNNIYETQGYIKKLHLQSSLSASSEPLAKILYLEDSSAIADLTKSVFQTEGFQVVVYSNAEDALPKIQSEGFDLIIADILLAGKMTGIAFVRHIRHLPEPYGKLPIIAISGLDKASHRLEALRHGATDFVKKPFDYDELVIRVKNLISSKELYDKAVKQEEELRSLALTDSLTQLYNRHYLTEFGLKRIKEAQRHQHALSVIIIDLDYFKVINDKHGHAVGDAVLQQVALVLKSVCRTEDFAIRLGGEEFILVLPHCQQNDAQVKAEKLCKKIQDLKPEGLSVTASLGVVGKSEFNYSDSFEQLFQLADSAVYASKKNGRNQVTVAKHVLS